VIDSSNETNNKKPVNTLRTAVEISLEYQISPILKTLFEILTCNKVQTAYQVGIAEETLTCVQELYTLMGRAKQKK
jgi:hypothetical protein